MNKLVAPLLCGLLAISVGPAAQAKEQRGAVGTTTTVPWLGVTARDGLAYFGRGDGFVIMDFSDPVSPDELGFLRVRNSVYDVAVEGDRAYLAAGTEGLVIVDLSDPTTPTRIQTLDSPGSARHILVREQHAFVAEHVHGMRVWDLSVPDRPSQRATVSTRGELNALRLYGDRLATAEGSGGVRLFDVRRPATPARRAAVPRSDGAQDVAFSGDLLLVAAGRRGLLVYRTAAHERPLLIAELKTEWSARGVLALDQERVLVACGPGGVLIVDLGNPAEPRVLSRVVLPRAYPAQRIALDGPLLFVVCDVAGFALADVSRPEEPVLLLPRRREMKVYFP